MPNVLQSSELVELIRKSGLLGASELDAHLAALGPDALDEPAALAGALVRRGVLTEFQAKQLLGGKWRNLILAGKYKLLGLLGTGGMGSVYLVEHLMMRRKAALKVLSGAVNADPEAVQRFQREAQAVAALDHPNIVRAFDIDRVGKLYFLVMEFVDGLSLQQLVSGYGPLAPGVAANYAAQAALGLHHAHEQGWIHRDVKPGNLLVDRDGTVKVLDLGLARSFDGPDEGLTGNVGNAAVLGTADYLAPEQAVNSSKVDTRADIYSLGATLYFMLTGRPPFAGHKAALKLLMHQIREPESIRNLRPEVPEALEVVVRRMMAKDPKSRYPTPLEAAAALQPLAVSEAVPPPGFDNSLRRGPDSQAQAVGSSLRRSGTSSPVRVEPPSTVSLLAADQETAGPTTSRPGSSGDGLRRQPRAQPAYAAAALLAGAGLVAAAMWFNRAEPSGRQEVAAVTAPALPATNPEVATTPAAAEPDPEPARGPVCRIVAATGAVENATFDETGGRVLTGGADGQVALWDAAGVRLRTFGEGSERVRGLAWLPGGRHFLAGRGRQVVRYDADTGEAVGRWPVPTEVNWITPLAGGEFGLLALSDSSLGVYDLLSGAQTKRFGQGTRPLCCAVTPDGRFAVSGGADRFLRLWELPDGKEVRQFGPCGQHVPRLSLDATGRRAVALTAGPFVRLWHLDTGEMKSTRVSDSVGGIAFTPDGTRLVTGDWGGWVRLYEADTGREVATLGRHESKVVHTAVSPDGKRALSCGVDGAVCVWRLPAD